MSSRGGDRRDGVRAVARAGAGLDHTAYDVNGELIVRFDEAPDPARRASPS